MGEVAAATVVDEVAVTVADEAIGAAGTKPMATRCSPQRTVCRKIPMAKNQNTVEKRRRETDKKRKAEEKRGRRRRKKEQTDGQAVPDTPSAGDS